ncbi:MAG: hypothetical protein ACR5KW_01120 [Wolbachia sp.]
MIIEPYDTYEMQYSTCEIFHAISSNNRLVRAGSFDDYTEKYSIKVL